MKTLIRFLIKFFPIHKLIARMETESNSINCLKSIEAKGNVHFYNGSTVSNQQNNPSQIVIGNETHIAGTLLVFGYGGKISIGSNCYLGDHSRIWSGESIEIGDNVLISHNVNIMDNNGHEIDYKLRAEGFVNAFIHGTKYLEGRVKTKKIIIGDNVWIGFNSVILKGTTIGEGAIIAAGSLVVGDVAPFTLVGGNPAAVIRQLEQ